MKKNEIMEKLGSFTSYFAKDGLLPTRIKWFAAGALLGSAVTYFLDPEVGSKRRSMVKDGALGLKDKAVKLGSDLTTVGLDMFSKAKDEAGKVANNATSTVKSKMDTAKAKTDSVLDRVGPDVGAH